MHFNTWPGAVRTPWRRCTAARDDRRRGAGRPRRLPYAGRPGSLAARDLVWLLKRAGHRARRRPAEAGRRAIWMAGCLDRPSPSARSSPRWPPD
ncbi:hypothetical protein HBB16_01460 [Pseudonocardia sp. MCCB 268]|nr:hypothetical protein [Pseudonocardia cytotoxica]